jgi:tripartite-type tricarboxylate transporter receptor subunit TctC
MFTMRIAAFLMSLAVSLITCVGRESVAAEERYPERPIRLVVPTGAGGNTDVFARVIRADMEKRAKLLKSTQRKAD